MQQPGLWGSRRMATVVLMTHSVRVSQSRANSTFARTTSIAFNKSSMPISLLPVCKLWGHRGPPGLCINEPHFMTVHLIACQVSEREMEIGHCNNSDFPL